MELNAWDEAGILPMAIRLRKAGKCPMDIDNLYGQIITQVVRMASILLPTEDPRYECHRKEFMAEDVQSVMLLQALTAAEKYIDTRKEPRCIINYLVKTVQNRLRNYVRDTENRKSKLDMVAECDLDFDIGERGLTVRNLDGSFCPSDNTRKVVTQSFN